MNRNQKRTLKIFGLATFGALALFPVGCQTLAPSTSAVADKGGAQLWTENCVRCHNIRSPSTLSDTQWELAAHHMRIRANLTAGETEKILAFLKSAN